MARSSVYGSIVRVGFAISRIDEAAATETSALFRELGLLAEGTEPE